MSALDGRLQPIAPGLGFGLRRTHGTQIAVGALQLRLRRRQFGTQRLQALFAFDDPGVRVLAPRLRRIQPLPTHSPDRVMID